MKKNFTMSRNNLLYSTIFLSGLVVGFTLRDYLPEDLNTWDKIGKKINLFNGNKSIRITKEEMAKKAELRQRNKQSNSFLL